MSDWSSTDEEDDLPQAPEYPTEENDAPPRVAPPFAVAPATSTPHAKTNATVSLEKDDTKVQDDVGPVEKEDEMPSQVSSNGSRYSAAALRALSEQRRQARLGQQATSAAPPPTPPSQEAPSAQTEVDVPSAPRTKLALLSVEREDREDLSVPPSPSLPSSPVSVGRRSPSGGLQARQSLPGRRRSQQSLSDTIADRQFRTGLVFLNGEEVGCRNDVRREEGDELAEILRAYKLLVETIPRATSPSRAQASAPTQRHTSSSPIFSITTVYRRGLSPAEAAPIVSEPFAVEKDDDKAASLCNSDSRRKKASRTTQPDSLHLTQAKPALLYVQLPPLWWQSCTDCGSVVADGASCLVAWLFDLCVVIALLLGTLVLGSFCDVVWRRMIVSVDA